LITFHEKTIAFWETKHQLVNFFFAKK